MVEDGSGGLNDSIQIHSTSLRNMDELETDMYDTAFILMSNQTSTYCIPQATLLNVM